MPFTVITLKNVPPSLRGDLTKWMQEISTGVYVGNFNTKVRDYLWERVCNAVGSGEATLSFAYRNEIGYDFKTINTQRQVIDYDGIPLVFIPQKISEDMHSELKDGFSNANKMHRAVRTVKRGDNSKNAKTDKEDSYLQDYVVIDIETTGLDVLHDKIIELGAVKYVGSECSYFDILINIEQAIPGEIINLTGIDDNMLSKEGVSINTALIKFEEFIDKLPIVGYYVNFDINFINAALTGLGLSVIENRVHDLIKTIRKEKLFQADYKLDTSLKSYNINKTVPHRALEDAKLIFELSKKVKKIY